MMAFIYIYNSWLCVCGRHTNQKVRQLFQTGVIWVFYLMLYEDVPLIYVIDKGYSYTKVFK